MRLVVMAIAFGAVVVYASAQAGQPVSVVLEHAIHFAAWDGGDVEVSAGHYRIEQGGESQLRLTTESNQSREVRAARTSHNETLSSPIVLVVIEEGQDDRLHLVLVLPGGQALDAVGSYSAVQSRAVASPALKPVQIQSAVSQARITPQPTAPQQAVTAPVPVVRVPQVPATVTLGAAVIKTGPSQPSELVSWDYIRMHDPDVIAGVIKDVQAGKLDPHSLAGLASPSTISALLTHNYAPLLTAPTPATRSAGNRWAEVLNPNMSAQLAPAGGISILKTTASALSPSAKALITGSMLFPDISPSQLNLGSVYNGHKLTGTIRVIAPVDSVVTAALPNDGKPFRIMKARTLSGRLVSAPYVLPSGQALQGVALRYEESASTMTPPYQLIVQSGQKIEYQVVFEPHMDVFSGNPVGNYATTLQVASDHLWTATVPITAQFNGIAIGVIGTIDDNSMTIIYDGTPCNRLIAAPATMTLTNGDQQPRSVSIGIASGAPSLHLQPFTLALAPGERKQVGLPLQVDACMQQGVEAVATLKYAYPGVERHADFGVTMYPSQLHWSHPGDDVGSCHYLWDIFALPNGNTSYYLEFENKSLILPMQLDLSFSALGQGLGSATFQDGPNAAGSVKTEFYTVPWSFVQQNYTRLFGAPVEARLSCHTH